jgi:hypothetical protein
MAAIDEILIPSLTLEEILSDGSTLTNPVADHRRLFLGEDGSLHLKDAAGAVTAIGGGASSADHAVCNGRLTLTTAVPITTTDVTTATTLYFTPFRGNKIGTYGGASWTVSSFTEKSITLAGLTAGLPYDCFIVDSTLALELTAWTNATTRATGISLQDGIYVKTGTTTRRYLGTICIAATGQSEDTLLQRYVWNYYNRIRKPLQVFEATDSWTYNSSTFRQARATTSNKVEYVMGVIEDMVEARVNAMSTTSSSAGSVGIGLDSTSTDSSNVRNEQASTGQAYVHAMYRGWQGIGYRYIAWLERARTGTQTFVGDGGQPTGMSSGLTAEVWA